MLLSGDSLLKIACSAAIVLAQLMQKGIKLNKMCQQKSSESEIETSKSRLDCQIRNTKMALRIDAVTAPYSTGQKIQHYYAYEFGVNSPQSQVAGRYIWLGIKLIALYLAKWFSWLIRRR